MKLVFIIPYFGEFKSYFQLFLNSCKTNPDVTWLIFTDNEVAYEYPKNVTIIHNTFQELKNKIQSKFDFPIVLDKPYKLCDYKPAYGYIFEEYIREYDAWGYCDTDLIWGDISKFINTSMLDQYDKIGDLGHCTIYKNTPEINTAFMLGIEGHLLYKQFFSTNTNNSFDEEYKDSINNIFKDYNYKILPTGKMAANIYTKSSDFKLTYLDANKHYQIEKKSKSAFIWQNGGLNRFTVENNEIKRDEYLYIHMQSRNMKVNSHSNMCYKIIPNSFDDLEINDINPNNFPKYKHMNLHYFRLRTHNLITKIKYKMISLRKMNWGR